MRAKPLGEYQAMAPVCGISGAGRFNPTLRLTADGELDLEWQLTPNKPKEQWRQSQNRGVQVAEVWLLETE